GCASAGHSCGHKAIVPTEEVTFFIPETIITIDKNGKVECIKGRLRDTFWKGKPSEVKHKISNSASPITKENYLKTIGNIQELIKEGNVYELNYCVPYTHKFQVLDPVSLHIDLLQKSPVPMAAFYKAKHLTMCGASMERYLSRSGNTLLSQPIKGTIGKGKTAEEDLQMISQLENSEKDKAENVMIVDLVRNDMARVSIPGTIQVNELFGIYSYLQVHQMISTITSELKSDISFDDIIRTSFPMGSMTGAPKIAAMEHIENLEIFKRGWYSGAFGYINPEGDFDFNVVIRSILCDDSSSTINYNAGGAITIDSDPHNEWDEVELKLKAITELLRN
ncbi:MAG: chorismate-binding protein, partial [Bacteroidia bacterium]